MSGKYPAVMGTVVPSSFHLHLEYAYGPGFLRLELEFSVCFYGSPQRVSTCYWTSAEPQIDYYCLPGWSISIFFMSLGMHRFSESVDDRLDSCLRPV